MVSGPYAKQTARERERPLVRVILNHAGIVSPPPRSAKRSSWAEGLAAGRPTSPARGRVSFEISFRTDRPLLWGGHLRNDHNFLSKARADIACPPWAVRGFWSACSARPAFCVLLPRRVMFRSGFAPPWCVQALRLISFNTSMTFDGIISGGSECGLSRVLCAECGGTFRSSSTLEYTRSFTTKLRCDNDGTERQRGRYKGERRLVIGCQYPMKVVVVVITSKASNNSDLGPAKALMLLFGIQCHCCDITNPIKMYR